VDDDLARGRQRVVETDLLGRPTSIQVGDLLPVGFGYDSRVASNHPTGHGRRRAAGAIRVRPSRETRDGDRSAASPGVLHLRLRQSRRTPDSPAPSGAVSWDDKGNLIRSRRGAPGPRFQLHAVDRTDVYSPPVLGPGLWSTDYDYALDRKPLRITRPDGLEIGFDYDTAAGSRRSPRRAGRPRINYDPATGHVASMTTPEAHADL